MKSTIKYDIMRARRRTPLKSTTMRPSAEKKGCVFLSPVLRASARIVLHPMLHPALLLYLRQQHVQQVVHEVEPLKPATGDARKLRLAWKNLEAQTSFRRDAEQESINT